MANINAHLPPTIAAPFHPPTENLQRDNAVRPVIPKTEIISSYTRLRDSEEQTQFSAQSRQILRDESKPNSNGSESEQSTAQRKRSQFFAKRGSELVMQSDSGEASMSGIDDFKVVMSVIESRYKNAVHPFPEPRVSLSV